MGFSLDFGGDARTVSVHETSCYHLPFFVIKNYIKIYIIHANWWVDELWSAGIDLIETMMNACTWYTWKILCTGWNFSLTEVTNLTFLGENCKYPPRMLPSGKKFPCWLKLQAESCGTEILDWRGEGVRADAWLVRVDRLKGSLELHLHFLRWDRRSYGTHETQTLKGRCPIYDSEAIARIPQNLARAHDPKATLRTLNSLKAAASRSDCSCAATQKAMHQNLCPTYAEKDGKV